MSLAAHHSLQAIFFPWKSQMLRAPTTGVSNLHYCLPRSPLSKAVSWRSCGLFLACTHRPRWTTYLGTEASRKLPNGPPCVIVCRVPWETLYKICLRTVWASLVAQTVKNPPAMQETWWVSCLGWEDPLEKGMATNSSILAWRIPWTEEPGGLQSTGSQRVGTTERLNTGQSVSGEEDKCIH